MATVKKASSSTPEQVVSNETLTVETPAVETPATPEVNKPLTRDELQAAFVTAKKTLREIEDANDFNTEHPDVKKAELAVFNAKKALKEFDDAIAKEALKTKMEQDMVNAKAVLKDLFNVSDDWLNEMLASDENAKKSLKWAFGLVFGKPEVNVKMGATSKSLTKSSQPAESNGKSEGNVNDVVGDLFNQGLTHDEIVAAGHSDGRIRNVAYKLDYARDKVTGKYAPRVR